MISATSVVTADAAEMKLPQQKVIRPEIKLTNRPNYHHVNFLLQAAAFVKCSGASDALSQVYSDTAVGVKQKGRVRLHPSLKRCVCKRCNGLLTPPAGSSLRLRKVSGKTCLVVKCERCATGKRFVVSDNHCLKGEKLDGYTLVF
ncbi:unnamed protein product [Soboliphyme baturini]|uniref:Rpr2-domain-containing protein n=1 Tax=Soboliphyme baturini TaxID=241478 RepID=A0A183J9P0_9BILA|nr:unnamed protein product [Soboliphyme baturini]